MELQFFPTPPELAKRLWELFKDREFSRVLEPSAGHGDLAAHHPWNREYARRPAVIDCCEIDVAKHAVLRDKGFKVVGLDFMQLEEGACYSHVVMNPPFNAGVKHVLRAFDILLEGEIAAIINAESIRNPFSTERQRLLKLIEQHGSVEFVEGAFAVEESARKTDVECALVYLKKQADIKNSIIGDLLAEMATDKETGAGLAGGYHDAQCLALPNTQIENTVLSFNAAVKAMRDSVFAEARSSYYSSILGASMAVRNGRGDSTRDVVCSAVWVRNEIGIRYDELKDRAWTGILRSTNVTSRLSSHAQRRLESEFEQIKKLEFSVSNIYGFLYGLVDSQGKMQVEMACDVFDSFSRYHAENSVFCMGWKSNSRHRTCAMRLKTTRFILPGFDSTYGGSLSWTAERRLADFDKVFAMLDGKREPELSLVSVFRDGMSRLKNGERLSCSYFDVRFYPGIGTIHFFPRDKKLIDRLNRLVGRQRQWLPPEGVEMPDAFWQQFDEAEKFDKAFRKRMDACAASSNNYSTRWNGLIHTFESCRGSSTESERERFAEAEASMSEVMAAILEERGICVDAMLEAKGFSKIDVTAQPAAQPMEQLPLLAA